jgi:hypothetical protein
VVGELREFVRHLERREVHPVLEKRARRAVERGDVFRLGVVIGLIRFAEKVWPRCITAATTSTAAVTVAVAFFRRRSIAASRCAGGSRAGRGPGEGRGRHRHHREGLLRERLLLKNYTRLLLQA